jgi:hypothetical protein
MDKLKNKIHEQIDQLNVDEPNVTTWADIKKNLPAPETDDLLKNYIAENKNELNIEVPDAQSWERINRVITVERKQHVLTIKKGMLYLSAACIIVIVSVGMLQHMKADKTNQNHEVVQGNALKHSQSGDTTNFEISKKDLTLQQPLPDTPKTIKGNGVAITTPRSGKKQKKKSLPPEVLQIQSDYGELISGQLKYTKSLAIYGESAGYFEQFKNDFKILEKQEKELRMSIVQNGLQENSIIDLAMIYQLKLTVLKKLQNEINKTSSRNKNLSDTVPVYIQL